MDLGGGPLGWWCWGPGEILGWLDRPNGGDAFGRRSPSLDAWLMSPVYTLTYHSGESPKSCGLGDVHVLHAVSSLEASLWLRVNSKKKHHITTRCSRTTTIRLNCKSLPEHSREPGFRTSMPKEPSNGGAAPFRPLSALAHPSRHDVVTVGSWDPCRQGSLLRLNVVRHNSALVLFINVMSHAL
jgi:hypothetical protein